MAISKSSVLSEAAGKQPLSAGVKKYLERRLANRLYDLIVSEFTRLENADLMSRVDLANKTGKDKSQITKILGGEGNWTVRTLAILLGAMGMELGPLSLVTLHSQARR